MSKTKFGKKVVSLVLALTMLFAVSVSAISASAYGPLGKAVSAGIDLISDHGYTVGPIGKAQKATHLVKIGIAKKILPQHDDLAIDIADVISDKTRKDVRHGVELAALNALPLSVKNGVATQLGLGAVDLAEQGADLAIIANDAKLLTASTAFRGLEKFLIGQHIWQLVVANAYALPLKTFGTLKVLNNVAELGVDNLGVAVGEALVIRGLLPAHLKLLPVPHVNSIIPGSPLTNAGKLLSLGTGLLIRDLGLAAIAPDVLDIALGGLVFNTPIADTQIAVNLALIPRHIFNKQLGTLGQLTGLASIGLGSALFIKNGIEVATEFIPATIAANATRHAAEAAVAAGLVGLHIADNIFWNALGAVLVARPIAQGAALAGAGALGAGALGAAGLGAAALAGTAAVAAPVATAAVAAPVVGAATLGAAGLGALGLGAAGLAGAAALAAPVVTTAVAAPVVGAAVLGTAAAGATALGAGALGAAALASNLLGGNDSSSSNTTAATPVQTVANAVESVLPSNDQNTQTETQAQETTNTSDASVASTDGPIE